MWIDLCRRKPIPLYATLDCDSCLGDCIFHALTAGLKLTWNRPVSVSSVSSGSFRCVWQMSSRPSVHSENSSSSCWSRISRTRSHFWRTLSASAHLRGLESRERQRKPKKKSNTNVWQINRSLALCMYASNLFVATFPKPDVTLLNLLVT